MTKTIELSLKDYLTIPNSLRFNQKRNLPVSEVSVDLASLYHHYYLDSYECQPPDPDPAHFEYTRFLLPTKDFRFQGRGLGTSSAAKRGRSNALGQAFCRWFLHTHFGIVYFAHMESVLGRQMHRSFNDCRLERSARGDTPDYFCAKNSNKIYLAEAKGRYTSISFSSAEFDEWRDQFSRVIFKDSSGTARSIKGHIVATRFATEQRSNVQTTLYAEDPESPGESALEDEASAELGTTIMALHYSRIMSLMNQPLLSISLSTGAPLEEQLLVQGIVWEILVGPFAKKRFIGGYYSSERTDAFDYDSNKGLILRRSNPLRLDVPQATFFGVEESIFRSVVAMARMGGSSPARVPTFDNVTPFYSGVSALRDGSVIGPLDLFQPVGNATM